MHYTLYTIHYTLYIIHYSSALLIPVCQLRLTNPQSPQNVFHKLFITGLCNCGQGSLCIRVSFPVSLKFEAFNCKHMFLTFDRTIDLKWSSKDWNNFYG